MSTSAVLVAGLSACSSDGYLVSEVAGALVADQFGNMPDPTLGVKLNPDFRYLRVEVAGRAPALLVLGYLDPHADGEIEVWYSSRHEVVKTQNGRIIGTYGLETDWRSVELRPALTPWAGDPRVGAQFARQRDEMPGYRFAISDQMENRPWPDAPPQGVSAVFAAAPQPLQWFREVTLSTTAPQVLPPAWFARGQWGGRASVVYSEQCLSPTFCLRLIRWPLQGGAE